MRTVLSFGTVVQSAWSQEAGSSVQYESIAGGIMNDQLQRAVPQPYIHQQEQQTVMQNDLPPMLQQAMLDGRDAQNMLLNNAFEPSQEPPQAPQAVPQQHLQTALQVMRQSTPQNMPQVSQMTSPPEMNSNAASVNRPAYKSPQTVVNEPEAQVADDQKLSALKKTLSDFKLVDAQASAVLQKNQNQPSVLSSTIITVQVEIDN